MGRHPEQDEIGIDLAAEHSLKVESKVGLPGEGLVVAKNPKAKAVGDDGPEGIGAAVQIFLNQLVGIRGSGPAHSGRPAKPPFLPSS